VFLNETSRCAWIRIVILICTSAQLFLLHKVICRLHVSTNKYSSSGLFFTGCHRMLCTHWDRSVFTSVKYLSYIICLGKWYGLNISKHVAYIYPYVIKIVLLTISIHSLISIQPWRPGLAGTRAQSCDRYGSDTLHPGQVLGGSLPLLSPTISICVTICIRLPVYLPLHHVR